MGGSERKTVRIANQLVKRGRKVHLAFLDREVDLEESLSSDVGVIFLDRSKKYDMAVVERLHRYVLDNNISKLWSVNLYPMLYLYLVRRMCDKKHRIRLIGSSNVTEFNEFYHKIKVLPFILLIWKMNHFVCGSYRQMQSWKKKYLLGFKRSVSVIHNGVDTERYSENSLDSTRGEIRNKYGIAEDEVVLGMVAQFRKEKAHKHCLQAVERLVNKGYKIRLVLVGDGPEKEDIEDYAGNLGILDKVSFTGLLTDVREVLLATDVFVLTSVAVETFSNAALEAMAMGNPAVLSDISGASEMIDENVNGFLYPPGDIDSLTGVLETLMSESTRIKMGKAARKKVEEAFSLDRMIDSYEELIWV